MKKTPPDLLVASQSPLARAVAAYTKVLLGGSAVVFFFYLMARRGTPQPLIRTAPAVAAYIPPQPLIDPGHVYSRGGVTITWPKLAKSHGESQQVYDNLLNVVKRWNPDEADPPATFTETLQHFNYSCPEERAVAWQFLQAEMPFKLYGVPEFDEVSEKWTDEYLIDNLRGKVEKAENNHFMFYKESHLGHQIPGWTPPNPPVKMSTAEFLSLAAKADIEKISSEESHHYLTSGSQRGDRKHFLAQDLRLFSTKENNFFIREVRKNKGIQCRFGMRGVTAASHFDHGRNMVVVLKGTRRYILNPPSACNKLSIYSSRAHPSFRHSSVDWSSIEAGISSGFKDADAIDTIMQAGEVLYIPSFWFHYVISLTYSAQCNSRHGSPDSEIGKSDIDQCFGKDLFSNE